MNSSKNKIVIELIEIVCNLEVKELFLYLNKGRGAVYGDQSQISLSSKRLRKCKGRNLELKSRRRKAIFPGIN